MNFLYKISSDCALKRDVLHYISHPSGKKIRSSLVFLIARLCDCHHEGLFVFAEIIESLHTASLLHDDVIDNGFMRRGKICVHHIWGQRASILLGDALINHTFSLLMQLGSWDLMRCVKGAVDVLIQGQLEECTLSVASSIQDYLTIAKEKTGSLFSLAAQGISILAELPHEKIEAFYQYGMLLGQAFQIIDDLKDYQAHPLLSGKKQGKDLENRIITLPLIIAYENMPSDKQLTLLNLLHHAKAKQYAFQSIYSLIHQFSGFREAFSLAKTLLESAWDILIRLEYQNDPEAFAFTFSALKDIDTMAQQTF